MNTIVPILDSLYTCIRKFQGLLYLVKHFNNTETTSSNFDKESSK